MELPKAILFDADGTLYESERIGYEASRLTALELHDFDLTWQAFEQNIIRGTQNTPELLISLGVPANIEQVHLRKNHHYARLMAERLKPMPGLVGFLDWCREKAILRLVVSANRRTSLDTALSVLGITGHFDEVISRETLGNKQKPDPYPYLLGLELAGVTADEAVAIEDTHKGLSSAKAAGLRCLGMLNETNDQDELRLADHIVSGFDEAKAYLIK